MPDPKPCSFITAVLKSRRIIRYAADEHTRKGEAGK